MESNVFSQSCRICSSELEHGVLVFSDEGKRLYLQAKIRKYLYITVSMDDKLPKIICNNCCTKLEGIHRFATMAVRNQDKLNKLMTDSTNCSTMDNKKMENKGLLHTYLTKGIIDKQTEDTEEMEVKVDPMLFFEYNSDQSEDNEYNDNENVSDVILETPDSTKIKNHEIQDDEKRKNFDCSICSKTFYSEFALQNHVWCHIPKNKRVVLNNHNNFYLKYSSSKKCENNVVDKREVEVNSDSEEKSQESGEAIDNSNNMRYACPICGKIISTKGNLKVHLETHRPKGKYGCDICGRIFKTQCNLHRHKEYHTGVQFTCGVCGRVYPTNSTLRAHSITHSDLRPHKCPLCDKTFKRNQDLKFHINQHTGARPYQCPYCPKAFASSGNCFSHRKRMHPLEVERDRERAAKIMR